jgi:hypothetical protein
MTDPRQPRAWNLDPIGNSQISSEQAHRAALAVAAAFPDDPLIARHLLDILGLLQLSRPHREVTGDPHPHPPTRRRPAPSWTPGPLRRP